MGAPLSHDDIARLHLESRDNPMTITAVLVLGAAITPAALDDLLRERLVTRPRFRDPRRRTHPRRPTLGAR